MRMKSIETFDSSLERLVESDSDITRLMCKIKSGTVCIIKHSLDLEFLRGFKASLHFDINDDEYHAREKNCANYRQKHWDHPSQVINAKFISWSFFPWNNESIEIFKLFRPLFQLRNVLSGLPKNAYIDTENESATARVAVQFYPCSEGYMAEHIDPLDEHQFAIPTLLLSDYGKDYSSGGFYILNQKNERVLLDKMLDFGSLVLFHTSIPHGVQVVDPQNKISECKTIFDGRLMAIAAVNSYANSAVSYNAEATNFGR